MKLLDWLLGEMPERRGLASMDVEPPLSEHELIERLMTERAQEKYGPALAVLADYDD